MGQESRHWVLCLGSHQALINVLGGPHFHVDISLGGNALPCSFRSLAEFISWLLQDWGPQLFADCHWRPPQILEAMQFLPVGFFSVAACFSQQGGSLACRRPGASFMSFHLIKATQDNLLFDLPFWLGTFITSAKPLHLCHTQLFRKKSQVLSMLRGRWWSYKVSTPGEQSHRATLEALCIGLK